MEKGSRQQVGTLLSAAATGIYHLNPAAVIGKNISPVVFLTPPPHFSTKKKTANQPTTAAVPENPWTKKGRDWLLSNFLFGTEIGGVAS